jgi:hypothetical protein
VNDIPFIAKPMTKPTQKHVKFQWIDEHENNISTLKNSLVTSPILTLPEPGKHFIVYCDASRVCTHARWKVYCLCF